MKCHLGRAMTAKSGGYNYFSNYAKVSFDGFINENLFLIKSPEKNNVQNIEIAHGITKTLIDYSDKAKKDIFLGLFIKSKFDGIGNRKPIDLSIALDISGSMKTKINSSSLNLFSLEKNRLTLAKEALIKLISIMNPNNDRLSLVIFNHKAEKVFGLLYKKDIEKKFLNIINSFKAKGNTDLVAALKVAINNFGNDLKNNKEKRIVLITDAIYKDFNNELLNLFKKCSEEYGIYITIMAISNESNTILADKVCCFKGCNYFPITKSSDLENYLVKNFKYIFFPIAHNTNLTIKSKNSIILKCLGGGNDFNIENNNNNNNSNSNNNEINFNLGSVFSSDLVRINESGLLNFYMKGGLVLLKIKPNFINNKEDLNFEINLKYETLDNLKLEQDYSYKIPLEQIESISDNFADENIQKGISIYYFAKILNKSIEKLNNNNYYNKKASIDEANTSNIKRQNDVELIETNEVLKNYLSKNFKLKPNNNATNDNFRNYMRLLDEISARYKRTIKNYYSIIDNAAPLPGHI